VAFIGHDVCLGKNLLRYMGPYCCADLSECGEPITLFISSLWSPRSWTSAYQFPLSSTRLAPQTIAHCEGLKSVSSRLDSFSTLKTVISPPSFQPAHLSDTQSEQEVEGCHRKLERSFFIGLSDENVP